jgi:hypothetical protein
MTISIPNQHCFLPLHSWYYFARKNAHNMSLSLDLGHPCYIHRLFHVTHTLRPARLGYFTSTLSNSRIVINDLCVFGIVPIHYSPANLQRNKCSLTSKMGTWFEIQSLLQNSCLPASLGIGFIQHNIKSPRMQIINS